MPREIYLMSDHPVSFEALAVAGARVDGQLAVRALYQGQAWQLVDGDEVAVLTIESSRQLVGTSDAARVTRGLARVAGPGPAWWTEASAPWGRGGEAGVAIMHNLAGLLSGEVRVEDGR
jgi:hypothetical protein